jgi:DNA-directed RNA polymerase subunit RPC12/RpoP
MPNQIKDVHTEHCCKLHGCKYRDPFCTVVKLEKEQEYLCEDCSSDGITSLKMLDAVMEGRQKRCPHCHHVLI